MNNWIKSLSLVLAALLIVGCVSPKYYTPVPDTHAFDEISEFSGTGAISLINAQPSAEEQLYHKQSKTHADYHAWTDVAIQIATRELEARGFTVREGTNKQIKLSIQSVLTETGWTQIQTHVIMRAETGSNYQSDFVGRNHSVMVANLERQADGAVMRVVAAMLSDQEIVNYLTNLE